MVYCLSGLGEAAHALHDHWASIGCFAEALTTAIQFENPTEAVATVISASDLLLSLGEKEKSLILLAFALRQDGIEQDVRNTAERLHAKLLGQLPEKAVAAAQRHS